MKTQVNGPRRMLLVAFAAVVISPLVGSSDASAGYGYSYGGRQYYSSWNYVPQRSYYYSYYYHRPVVTRPSYNYHYCIHYPSQPRYVYYYNPHRGQYWGRLDLEGNEGAQYSLLKKEDRKAKLSEIPESAFPEPGPMPEVPGAEDAESLLPVPNVPGVDLPDDGIASQE